LLEKYLRQQEILCSTIREPGSTDLANRLRQMLMFGGLDKRSELALFFAARADNVTKNILVRKNSEHVICDRYIDSTIAYQCYGNESISLDTLKPMLRFFSYGVVADITFVLDVDYDESRKRILDRSNNHYDDVDKNYFLKVQSYYRTLKQAPYYYIDTTYLDTDQVHQVIIKILEKTCQTY